MKYKPIRSDSARPHVPPAKPAQQDAAPAPAALSITPQPQTVAPSFMQTYLSNMATYSQFRG